jgi:hypothetical protein
MLWCLIWTFTLYTIFLLPTMMFFSSGTAYAGVKNPSSYLDTYIGNLGYASVQCMTIPENVGSLVLSCPYGTIGEIHDYGINPTKDTRLMCKNGDANKGCKPTSSWVASGLNTAIGNEKAPFSWNGSTSYWWGNSSWNNKPECMTVDSTLFVQFSCVMPVDKQASKYSNMALAVGMGVLIAFLFTVSVRYMFQGGKI